MKRNKKNSRLYSFLAEKGAFSVPLNDEQFAMLRKDYERIRKATWRRLDRQRQHYYSVPVSKMLYPVLKSEAKKRNMSITKLLRECAVNYLNQTFLLDEETLSDIRTRLSQTYFEIKQGLEVLGISIVVMEGILKLFAARENEILHTLKHPPTLFDMVKSEVTTNANFRQSIVALLNSKSSS